MQLKCLEVRCWKLGWIDDIDDVLEDGNMYISCRLKVCNIHV